MKQARVLSLNINLGSFDSMVDLIIDKGVQRTSSYVCLANVHMTIEAANNVEFADVVNQANLVLPDGKPIAYVLNLMYGTEQVRIAGMDLLPVLLGEVEKKDLSVFFYGGTPEMLEATKKFLEIKFPNLTKSSFYSPPFRQLTMSEEDAIISEINGSGANLIFVVLGCPKQEKWMHRMKGRVQGCMVGVGGALPVMIGLQKRAPMWMQRNGLEWLYRFFQEPRRLWRRYLITNSLFIYLVLKNWIKKKMS